MKKRNISGTWARPCVLATRSCILAKTVHIKKQNGRKLRTVRVFYARPCVLACCAMRGSCAPWCGSWKVHGL